MRRYLLALLTLAAIAWAANIKLYLKDGDYHIVREYKVQGDRVRFYSVERSDWEEMPLDLVDLKRTESEAAERNAELEKDKAAEASVHSNKGRQVLAKLSPIPMVSGKGTLELQGAHSQNVFANPEQEFYFQLSDTERFGMIKLTPKGTVRIVENLTFVPITKEVVEEPTMVPTFQKQLADGGLYKVWPRDSLEPGEYAVVEYTEGKLNIQVFDFAIQPKK
ncbi:conserved exported hypothetical protein [Candidatus Sulfopaludibacter sp. SbA4]|nr:conserved exported hypothetical protein [Candidatus Sulfopaludibacter sp. SbA4]